VEDQGVNTRARNVVLKFEQINVREHSTANEWLRQDQNQSVRLYSLLVLFAPGT